MTIEKNKIYDPYNESIEEMYEINELLDYSDVLAQISESLVKYRNIKKLNQKQLAEKLEMNQSMISKLESGEYNATLKMLLKISYKLMDTSDLFIEIIDEIKKRLLKKYDYKNIRLNKKYEYTVTNKVTNITFVVKEKNKKSDMIYTEYKIG